MDKNTKIGLLLIGLIIVAMSFFQPEQKVPDLEEKDLTVKTDQITTQKTVLSESSEAAHQTQLLETPVYQEKKIKVETDLFEAEFSTRNGIVKSFKLKKYKQRQDSSLYVDLIRENTANLSTEIFLNNGKSIKDVVFIADRENLKLSSGSNTSGTIIFSYKDETGKTLVTKSYTFYNDKYSFDIKIDKSPIMSQVAAQGMDVNWKGGMRFTEVSHDSTNTNREEYYLESYCKTTNDDRNEFSSSDDPASMNGSIEWGATRVKYFEVFIASLDNKFSRFNYFPSAGGRDMKYSDVGFSLGMAKNNAVDRFMVFIGPMDNDLLSSYDKEFETTLNWGWDIIKPFSKGIFWTMSFLHRFISNYGIVIILLSLLVNTILLPFTIKAYKSQIAMKKIQPHLAELKNKHKNDMQKQQQETMALYKKHKVNPFGSCLPMMVPMLILSPMFIIFGSTIEFRNAYFAGWITDLSLPEVMFSLPFSIPFYGANVGLLPIFMAVTMYLQMKDTTMAAAAPSNGQNSTADAMAMNQKMMKYFMPVMMLVMFNNFASGLILYYCVGNVFRLVQQKFTKKLLPSN